MNIVAHPRDWEAHTGTIEGQPRDMEANIGSVKAHSRDVEAHIKTVEALSMDLRLTPEHSASPCRRGGSQWNHRGLP
jgi:hypothetical protein